MLDEEPHGYRGVSGCFALWGRWHGIAVTNNVLVKARVVTIIIIIIIAGGAGAGATACGGGGGGGGGGSDSGSGSGVVT